MEKNQKESIWNQIDMKVFVPGMAVILLVIAVGIFFPNQFYNALHTGVLWIMDHFKWFYILLVILICGLFAAICFTKLGDIRLGGKKAKPSLKTST